MFNKLEACVLSEYKSTLIKHYFSFIKHYFEASLEASKYKHAHGITYEYVT
jgi:hypothetical protein